MSKQPPIPPEQRAFRGPRPKLDTPQHDRRDEKTGLQSGQPGDADANLREQGRYGNIRQNTSSAGYRHQGR